MMSQSTGLKKRCVYSAFVLAAGTVAEKGLAFASKIILTRLLVPEAIGLMVLILSMGAIFETFTEVGIKESIIQNKKGANREYLNMAWWFQGLRGIGLYVVAFSVAPRFCQFYFAKPEIQALYTMPELLSMVRLALLSILFNGLTSPRAHVLQKEFKFGKSVLLVQGGAILGTIITIYLAFIMRNAWALVIGFFCTAMLKCVFSHIMCPFLPRFSFDWDSFRELSRFASGIFGLPVLAYIAFNTDILVAGRLISSSMLGMYGMALSLAMMPREFFASAISPILLPAFAERQHDKPALCKAVLKITRVTALLTIPFITLAILVGKDILSVVYGAQYSIVAAAFGLLCVHVLLLMQGGPFAGVLYAVGQPGKHRTFVGLRALILVVLIYPATKLFGVTGVATAVLLASLVALCAQVRIVHTTIGLSAGNYALSWLPGLGLAIPVIAVQWVLKEFKPDPPIWHLVVSLLWSTVVCIAGLFLSRHFDKLGRYVAGCNTTVKPTDSIGTCK